MSKDRTEWLARLAPQANWDWNLKTDQWWNNDDFEANFGSLPLEEGQSLKKYIQNRIHPEDVFNVRSELKKAFKSNQDVWSEEFRLLLPNQTWAYVRAKAYLVREEGGVGRMVGTLEDLTETKGLKEEYQQYKEYISLALLSAGVGIWSMSLKNRMITWDAQCQKLFHSTDSSLLLDDFLSHVHPEDLPVLKAGIENPQKAGTADAASIDFRYVLPNQTLHIRLIGKAYYSPEGIIDYFTGAVRDVTEDKRKESALKNVEKQFQAAFDYALLGIVIADTDGNFLLVNKAFTELTGYAADELYQGNYKLITYPEDLNHQPWVNSLITGKETTFTQQKRYIRKDGKVIWVVLHTTLILGDEPKESRFFSIIQDVTEEVSARDQQKRLLALVENSSEFMAIFTLHGDLTYINQAGQKLAGIEAEDLILSRRISEFFSTEQYQSLEKTVLPAMVIEGHWAGEIQIRHFKTGEIIPVYANGILIRDESNNEPIARGFMLRDLRKEILTQQALSESESRFRNLVGQAPVAIGLLKGWDMVIETANESILNLWGRDEKIIGMPLMDALPELRGQGFLELLRDVYRTGKPFYGYEILTQVIRNGQKVACYFNFVYAAVRDSDEQIIGVSIVATEVTDQIKSKKELQFSEERFRSFIVNSPTPIAIYEGTEMRIRMANQAVLDTWGRDASVIGKTFREVLPELDSQEFYKLLDQVYQTGVPYVATEDRVDLMIGGKLQTHYFSFVYKALRNSNGVIYGVMNTATDVTALVNAKQQVQDAEQNLRSAIALAELGTWSRHLVTDTLTYSDRVSDWFGFKNSSHGFSAFMSAVHPEDRERVSGVVKQVLTPGMKDHYSIEFRVIHLKTGEERSVQAQGKVSYDQQGKPYLLSGTVRDVTAEKRTAKELERLVSIRTMELQKANELLQASNQELEQYAYVASHDLQEPLRKIRMFSGIIQEMPQLPEAARTSLAKVVNSSERMTLLIKDLLEFSRLLKSDRVYTMTDLNEVIRNVISDFELSIQEKSARIQVDRLPQIEAVSLQMNQLFYNLISNALKFTRPGETPQVIIACRVMSAEEVKQQGLIFKEERYYDVTVSDNGIGFQAQYKEQIFEVFKRLHTRETYPGTGVGLALCKKIAINHGGVLWAESEEGKGSVFHIILPEKQIIKSDHVPYELH
ncbi:PAS domain S-box protein [Siphonobacter sp. SORGH_AS_1065]|uniref:PAS domain-containing sensor histidine kinase n=1 Tax=Siphonobacter sp. SORGH_AS_1065 TaxID=3041795 RepID=UPI00278242AC|nr:PAS domain S-box protein [Siphonobacter sp. SORGH_AS_1065]MDQ1089216.1 PAS domain S-box-containing protein [Siphonobacter sp. SORGH_AS_1065]